MKLCFVLSLLVGLSWGQSSTTVMPDSVTPTASQPASDSMTPSMTPSDSMNPSVTQPPASVTPSVTPPPASVTPSVTPPPASMTPSMTPGPSVTPPPDITVEDYAATRRYRDATFYAAIYDTTYDLTRDYRLARFNCHERNARGVITNRVPSSRVFTMYLHMPVLHFLTENYKRALMNSLANVIGTTASDLCIDGHDQAFVSTFEEGVLLRIYHRGTPTPLTGLELSDRYYEGLSTRSGNNFVRFLGKLGLNYNSSRAAILLQSYVGRYSINIGGCRQLASEYNMYNGRNLTAEELSCINLSREAQQDIRDSVPENPDPVNYYLEAGDYVFSVIGAIVVAIVLGLAILGYFIHPFFLA